MRHLLSALLLPFLVTTTLAQPARPFTSVPNDPIGVRQYTLENGLKVFLSHNPDAPRVMTNIVVRAGSKHDPADATGLAHYLEHMLFKGTSRIGTKDWPQEQALLQAISDQYELRRRTTDEAERDRIYRRIDSLSLLAAAHAIPNEYDKMLSSIGARGTNAYTSNEQTVYVNDIPVNELERWMMIEAERFQECVLRLFHTELETVFEEFNRGQDNDFRGLSEAVSAALYPTHPYGQQTTIGKGEHLKNPSMVKIHEYFDRYYVPNNMAIVLAGDIDMDRTIALVERHFGKWKPKPVTPVAFPPEAPLAGTQEVVVFGPDAEWVEVTWRLEGAGTDQALLGQLVAGILSNGRAGLFDLELEQKQRVLDAGAWSFARADHGQFTIRGEAKQGQTLEEVRDLLLGQLERVRSGDLEDWLPGAVINDMRQRRMRSWTDNNGARVSAMTNAFILGLDWAQVVEEHDRMARFTKDQVVAFAQKHLGEGRVVGFKRTGPNDRAFRVTKPSISAIPIDRQSRSQWVADWWTIPSERIEPQFLDYPKAIHSGKLSSGIPFHHVPNKTTELFSLVYLLDMGTDNDRHLELAMEYLPYLGTPTRTPEAVRKELFRLGLNLSVFASRDRVYVTLSGLERHLSEGVQLLEDLLRDPRPDEQALAELVKDVFKTREDQWKNKNIILQQAMADHAVYGPRSPFTHVLSREELLAVKPEDLLTRIRDLTRMPHAVFHYGRTTPKAVIALLDKHHKVPAQRKPYPPATVFPQQATDANTVLFVDHDMVQTEMLLVSKAGAFQAEVIPQAMLLNQYFGSGLSSVVFQEIRESKALAYGASCNVTTPDRPDEAHYVRAFIGTQSDKLGDAVTALKELMADMPMDDLKFEAARDAALKRIESERITRENIFWSWDRARRMGFSNDPREQYYKRIQAMDLPALKAFFDRTIKGRAFTHLVIGKKSLMDREQLERMGPLRELSLPEIFGYEAAPQ